MQREFAKVNSKMDGMFEQMNGTLNTKLEEMNANFDAKLDTKLEQMNTNFDAKLDAKLEQMNTNIDDKLEWMRIDFDDKLEKMNKKMKNMDQNYTQLTQQYDSLQTETTGIGYGMGMFVGYPWCSLVADALVGMLFESSIRGRLNQIFPAVPHPLEGCKRAKFILSSAERDALVVALGSSYEILVKSLPVDAQQELSSAPPSIEFDFYLSAAMSIIGECKLSGSLFARQGQGLLKMLLQVERQIAYHMIKNPSPAIILLISPSFRDRTLASVVPVLHQHPKALAFLNGALKNSRLYISDP